MDTPYVTSGQRGEVEPVRPPDWIPATVLLRELRALGYAGDGQRRQLLIVDEIGYPIVASRPTCSSESWRIVTNAFR
jgi:hypothetical protein